MKKIFVALLFISAISQSCSKKIASSSKIKQRLDITDSIKFVSIIPDENFYPTGDSICTVILKNYKKLTPKLIDKISDTTNTSYKYADSYFFKVGDVSLNLLSVSYNHKDLKLREILKNNFKLKNPNDQTFTICYDLFHSNSSKENLKNRLKMEKALRIWYKNKSSK